MKALSNSYLRNPLTAMLFGAVLSSCLVACEGRNRTPVHSWQAYSLPLTRTGGQWQSPTDKDERQRLEAIVKAQFASFQECQWRHAGAQLAGSGATHIASPVIGRFGVDSSGHVVWFEMSSSDRQPFGLRECYSERLLKLEFNPPPAGPVMLMLTLPQFKPPGISQHEVDAFSAGLFADRI